MIVELFAKKINKSLEKKNGSIILFLIDQLSISSRINQLTYKID